MRMTAKQLRRIIREEVARVRLSEAEEWDMQDFSDSWRPTDRSRTYAAAWRAIEKLPDDLRHKFDQRLDKAKSTSDLKKLVQDVQDVLASRGPLSAEDVETVCVYAWQANEPIVPKLVAMAEKSGLEVDTKNVGRGGLEIWLSGPAGESTFAAMVNVAYAWNKYAIKKKLNGEDVGQAWGYPSDPGVGPWGSDNIDEVEHDLAMEME